MKKNTLTKSNGGKKGFILAHNSRVQSISAGKGQWQNLDTFGHIASIIKDSCHSCLILSELFFFSHLQSRTPNEGNLHINIYGGFSHVNEDNQEYFH